MSLDHIIQFTITICIAVMAAATEARADDTHARQSEFASRMLVLSERGKGARKLPLPYTLKLPQKIECLFYRGVGSIRTICTERGALEVLHEDSVSCRDLEVKSMNLRYSDGTVLTYYWSCESHSYDI